MKIVGVVFAIFITILSVGTPRPSFAQAPAPVPALPDTERRTSYSVTGSTCACSVGFALYGDSTDYQNWVEVYLNGVLITYNDPLKGWTITSPTGPLATIPRPVTDAVLTFANAQTGTVQIVGARRPRRTMLFQENRGVAARDLNQGFNDIFSQNRETWDKINDVTGRALLSQPGNTIGPLPAPAACAANYLGFDATGLNPVCLSTTTGVANFNSPPPIGNVIPNTGAFTALNIAYQNTFAPGVRGPEFIWTNPSGTTPAGQVAGLQIWVGNNPTATPQANTSEASLVSIVNGNNRFKMFGYNIICGVGGPENGVDFIDTPCVGQEIDLFNSASYLARSRVFGSATGTYNKIGSQVFNSPAIAQVTAAYVVWTPSTAITGAFYEGFVMARVSDIGLHFISDPGGSVDTYDAFGVAAIEDDSRSASLAKFGNFAHSGAMIDVSSGGAFAGGFYKGSGSGATIIKFTNGADFNTILNVDSGNTVDEQSVVRFSSHGVDKWDIIKTATNTAAVFNATTGHSVQTYNLDDSVNFLAGITVGSATLIASSVALTNDAAAATATFTNAPTAGNPKKWIPINDNGTILDIPAVCHTPGC